MIFLRRILRIMRYRPGTLWRDSQENPDSLRHSALEVIVGSDSDIFHFVFKKLPARRVSVKVLDQ
jgi:hypothetical protein